MFNLDVLYYNLNGCMYECVQILLTHTSPSPYVSSPFFEPGLFEHLFSLKLLFWSQILFVFILYCTASDGCEEDVPYLYVPYLYM